LITRQLGFPRTLLHIGGG